MSRGSTQAEQLPAGRLHHQATGETPFSDAIPISELEPRCSASD